MRDLERRRRDDARRPGWLRLRRRRGSKDRLREPATHGVKGTGQEDREGVVAVRPVERRAARAVVEDSKGMRVDNRGRPAFDACPVNVLGRQQRETPD